MNAYYLVASLPALALGDPPPFSRAEMPARCANMLSEAEQIELQLLLEGREGECTSGFVRHWHRADTQMRNAVARIRAGKLQMDAGPYLRDHEGFDVSLEKAVADAYARPNPMERELALDRCRWHLLDGLILEEPFAFSAVLAWAVKLRLAERWAGLKDETGRKAFETWVEAAAKAGIQDEALKNGTDSAGGKP